MTIYQRPDVLPVWSESGDTTQPTNPEIQEGWPLSTVPPSRQRFNWILNFVANAMRYLLQFGVSEWVTTEDYPLAARVQHAGVTWVAILANTGIEPGTDPTKWERWGFSATELAAFLDPITLDGTNNRVGINQATPLYSLDVGATDGIRIPKGTTAQRPAGNDAVIRYNSTTLSFEGYGNGLWGSIGGGATGGNGDKVFYENDQTVNNDYTIKDGKNAMSAGTITIASGKTVTVPSGSSWTIVGS